MHHAIFFLIFPFLVFFFPEKSFALSTEEGKELLKTFSSPFKSPKQVAMLVGIKGIVIVTKADGSKRMARIKDAIHVGDRIETGLGAVAHLEFVDQSKIKMQGSSDYTVKDYTFTSSGKTVSTGKIGNGMISFMAGLIGKVAPQHYKIETATATVGIRGSSGEVVTADGSIPGRPPSLAVMKKGGVGISLAPRLPQVSPGAAPPPIMVVTESGRGFTISATGSVERVTFDKSPGEVYAKQERARIEKAKKKTAQKEKKKEESTASEVEDEAVESEESEIVESQEDSEAPVESESADVALEESEPVELESGEVVSLTDYDASVEETPAVEVSVGEIGNLSEIDFNAFSEIVEVNIETSAQETPSTTITESIANVQEQVESVSEITQTVNEDTILSNAITENEEAQSSSTTTDTSSDTTQSTTETAPQEPVTTAPTNLTLAQATASHEGTHNVPFTDFLSNFSSLSTQMTSFSSLLSSLNTEMGQVSPSLVLHSDFSATNNAFSSLISAESNTNTAFNNSSSNVSSIQSAISSIDPNLINSSYASILSNFSDLNTFTSLVDTFFQEYELAKQDPDLQPLGIENIFTQSSLDQLQALSTQIKALDTAEDTLTPIYTENANLSSQFTTLFQGTLVSDTATALSTGFTSFVEGFSQVASALDVSNYFTLGIDDNLPNTNELSEQVLGVHTYGNGIEFDGVDDAIQIPDTAINNLTQGTIEAWIYLDSNTQETILAKQYDGVNTMGLFTVGFTQTANPGIAGKIYFHAYNDIVASSSTNLSTGQWHHVAVTFNSTEAKIYIDGSLDSTTSGNFYIPNYTSVTATTIGSWNNFGHLDGKIDEVRIWSVVRTDQEISNNYNTILDSSDDTGLSAYYRFADNGAIIDDAFDFSGNGLEGSILGDPIASLSKVPLSFPSHYLVEPINLSQISLPASFSHNDGLSEISSIQAATAITPTVSNFQGSVSGIVFEDSYFIEPSNVTLNFLDSSLTSGNTWQNFGSIDPSFGTYNGTSVLALAAKDSSPSDLGTKETVILRSYGHYGSLNNLSLDYAFRSFAENSNSESTQEVTSDLVAPKIGLHVSVPTNSLPGSSFKRFTLVSGPLPDEFLINTSALISNTISQASGNMWLMDTTNPQDPKILVDKGSGPEFVTMQELIAAAHYGLNPQIVNYNLSGWLTESQASGSALSGLDQASLGASLSAGLLQGVDILFNLDAINLDDYDSTTNSIVKNNVSLLEYIRLTDNAGSSLLEESWEFNQSLQNLGASFISKNSFYIPDASTVLPKNLPGTVVSSYMVTIPNSFDTINWGIWGATLADQVSQSNKNVFGYFATGDLSQASRLADRDLYLNQLGSPTRSYSGSAIGSIFGAGRDGQMVSGSATLNVNFSTGAVSGGITFPQDTIDFTTLGRIDEFESAAKNGLIFKGPTVMNGASFVGGTYQGQFFGRNPNFAEEAAGTFNASDGVRAAIGAFGVDSSP